MFGWFDLLINDLVVEVYGFTIAYKNNQAVILFADSAVTDHKYKVQHAVRLACALMCCCSACSPCLL